MDSDFDQEENPDEEVHEQEQDKPKRKPTSVRVPIISIVVSKYLTLTG